MIRKVIYIASAVIGVILFFVANDYANSVRGYSSVGGEGLFLFMPMWVLMADLWIQSYRNHWED